MKNFRNGIVLFFIFLIYVSAVFAQTSSPTPDVLSIASDGVINAIEQDESHIYIGGNFKTLNLDRKSSIEQPNYAIIDNTTRGLSAGQHTVNASVEDIIIVGDRVYLAGAFTSIDNQPRSHLAAFNLPTMELIDWAPEIEGIVKNIELEENLIKVTTTTTQSDYSIKEEVLTVNPENGTSVVVQEQRVIPKVIATTITPGSNDLGVDGEIEGLMVDKDALGFQIPSLGDILTFAIRAFFSIAGLVALFYLLLGAFAWVTSGGDKDAISAARDKIQAAVVGLIMMVAMLAVVWTLEQVVFKRRICLGLSCPVTLPSLIQPLP